MPEDRYNAIIYPLFYKSSSDTTALLGCRRESQKTGEEIMEKVRCCWVNPRSFSYIRYHDEEWGISIHDDHKLFEMLILESFQAGLSWECILNKREAFRRAFDGFDVYGHLDYIVRYVPEGERRFSYSSYAEQTDAILRLLIQKGKGIDVFLSNKDDYFRFINYMVYAGYE